MKYVSRFSTAFFLVFLVTCFVNSARASAEQFPVYTLTQGELDDHNPEMPISGAKLCLIEKPDVCYQMPSSTTPGVANSVYEFGLNPIAERLSLISGDSWISFSGTFAAGGSGGLRRLAILRYQASDKKIVNLLPMVAITNIGEEAVWNIQEVSDYPVLVDADFVWGQGETHFDFHYYTIEAWLFNSKADHYVKAFSYKTIKKYSGEDHKVLESEKPKIIRRLEMHKRNE